MVTEGVRRGIIVQRGTWLAYNNVQEQAYRRAGPDATAERIQYMHDLDNEIRAFAGIA